MTNDGIHLLTTLLFWMLKVALHYYASLNALQYQRKTALIDPLIGYLQAMKSHYILGYEALGLNEVDEFLANISASVQG